MDTVTIIYILAFIVTVINLIVFYITRRKSRRVVEIASGLTVEKSREENLLEAMADGVMAVDRDRQIVILNKAAEQILGLTAEDVIGLKSYDVIKLYDEKGQNINNKESDLFVESWHSGKVLFREVIYTSGSSSIVLALSVAPVRNFEGTITGGISIFRDVTQQKEVDRMRNEFVSIASHEMRTPLFTIEGYLSLAQTKAEKNDPKALDYLKKARSSVISMSNLLNNLLIFSKIEEGKVEKKSLVFDLSDEIRESIKELKPKSDVKYLSLEFKESTNSELGKKAISGKQLVKADPEKIKEVLINLIDNGIKFTREGGVEVTVGGGDASVVKVCVKDTGPGISKPEQARLFQKFYRVDNTFTREVGGTGLGLYLSREMVEYFGGKIWVESEEGKGATFCFTLPRVNE